MFDLETCKHICAKCRSAALATSRVFVQSGVDDNGDPVHSSVSGKRDLTCQDCGHVEQIDR